MFNLKSKQKKIKIINPSYGSFTLEKPKFEIKIKLQDGATLPEYKNSGDSGADLRSIEDTVIPPMERAIIRTGLFFEIPQGFEVQIRSRSGLAAKEGVFVLNSPGTIDSSYRGEIKIILQNLGKDIFSVSKGDRIAQMVVSSVSQLPFTIISALNETERGAGGFGSTGIK